MPKMEKHKMNASMNHEVWNPEIIGARIAMKDTDLA